MQQDININLTNVFQRNWAAMHAKDENGKRLYKYIINEGSSRSSKTFSLIDCFDLYARGNSFKRLTVWRDTKTDTKKTVLVDMIKRLKSTGRWELMSSFNKTESILTYSNDSTFEIHGTDDEETVHGLTQDAAWLNEPYKISKDTFDQIDQRTSDFIFIDWNPKKAHWIENIKKDNRAIVIHSTFADNPFCPPEQRDKILSYQPVSMCKAVTSELMTLQDAIKFNCLKALEDQPNNKIFKELLRCQENEFKLSADAYKWSVYGLGIKAEKPNRIFSFTEISDQEYNSLNARTYTGVDWGAVDPWGVVDVKYYDGAIYLHERNYQSENEIRSKLTNTERMQIEGADEGIVKWLFSKMDIPKNRYLICDNNREAKILALREAGWDYAIAAPKGKGSILDGIDRVNDLKVYYTSSSTNLKYEQENYSRKVDKYGSIMEEPEDMDNHILDCVRYVVTFLHDEGVIKKL